MGRATEVEHFEIPAGELSFTARAAGPASGRLVLLLHGFPESSRSWNSSLTALAAAGYRAVAFDQRGYSSGARPEGVAPYQVPHLVADALAVADWLGGHRFDLVGHDWGGAVAWALAGRYPQRLSTLSVVSTPHPAALTAALSDASGDQAQKSWYFQWFQTPDEPERALLDNDAAGLRSMYAELPQEAADEYVALFRQPGALTAALNWYRAMSGGLVSDMGPVTTPTMYVWSTDDIALGRAAAEATARHVEGPYRFEVLEGVSHWIPEVAADQLSQLLIDHLSAHD